MATHPSVSSKPFASVGLTTDPSNLVTSLLTHERIVTTVAKAKEASRLADKMITLGKRGTPTALSSAQSFLYNHAVTMPRLTAMAERYAVRPGGYTRLHLMGHRKNDHAPRAVLELVDNPTDVKLDMTARAMAREAYILLHKAQKNIGWDAVQALLQAQSDVPLEQDVRFHDLTRKNITKLVRYRGEDARQELTAKAAHYLERLWAENALEGARRPDEQRWDAMELARPSRGRTITRPMHGLRQYAGQLSPEIAAQVGTETEVAKPLRLKDRTISPTRIERTTKPSVVRLAKGVFAKRRVRGTVRVPSP